MRIDRSTLEDLLARWEAGDLDESQVHEQAEEWWDTGGAWPELPKTDPDSIPIEVLSQLDVLNWQFITTEDIPAIRRFLRTPPGSESSGWLEWRSYWDVLDLEARKRRLAGNAYYCA